MPHTLGPWQHGEPTFAVPDRFVRTAAGEVIAYCDGPLDIAKANAKLIAAAPELLEALRLEHSDAHDDNGGHPHCQTCALIAKAEA